GVEPHVEHVGDAAHHGGAGGVVGVGPHEFVDVGPVQVGDLLPEGLGEFGEGAVHLGARVFGVVTHPHGDRGAPIPVAGDRPVAGAREPFAELAVLDVLGHPRDVFVQFDHAVLELGHAHEPAAHRLVDERVPAAPTVRVGVVVGLVTQQHGAGGDRSPALPAGDRLEVGGD